jgi:adenosylcobinamide kinase / adenosylcobinamide-phosphate guanylyltransferase
MDPPSEGKTRRQAARGLCLVYSGSRAGWLALRSRSGYAVAMDVPGARCSFVIGGARSGKSRFAEGLVTALPPPWTYIATAEPFDDEMRERIAQHRADRGEGWETVDVTLALPGAIVCDQAAGRPILVDCLTLWLSNLMLAERDIEPEVEHLLETLRAVKVPIVLVSNEVGLGIVPDNALARKFRDHQGRLNQRVAALASTVVFMAAGLPMVLKGSAP